MTPKTRTRLLVMCALTISCCTTIKAQTESIARQKITTNLADNNTRNITPATMRDAMNSVVDFINVKVDKIEGKGLSTYDFTAELKAKLDAIASGATVSPWSVGSGVAYYTGGNIGIGTSVPTSKLHVVGSRITIESSNPTLHLKNANTNTSINAFELSDENVALIANRAIEVNPFGGQTTMYIQNNDGNVGIGVPNPTFKLAVRGDIGFDEEGTTSLSQVLNGKASISAISNVDNTRDLNKPVSIATASALVQKVDKVIGKDLSTNDFSTAEKTKLAGIATGATANSSDAVLRDRTTHTGTQAISTITNLATTLNEKAQKNNPILDGEVILTSLTGNAGKVLALDNFGKIIPTPIPDNISDVGFGIDGENVLSIYRSTAQTLPEAFLIGQIGVKTLAQLRSLTDNPYKIIFVSDLANFFYLDDADFSTADNGTTVIVSSNLRFKILKMTVSQITALQTALDLLAPKANPTFSGSVNVAQGNVATTTGVSAITSMKVLGGKGGNNSANSGAANGGNGGGTVITGGNGGDITGTPTTGIGGIGANIDLTAGDGGIGGGTTAYGGNGGMVTIAGGTAGFGANFSGNGGDVAIKGGNASSSGNSSGGDIYFAGGYKTGTGTDGDILLGVSPSLSIRGNVGIGTYTPAYKLDVAGTGRITSNSGNTVIGSISSGYGGISFGNSITGTNYALAGNTTHTYINRPSGGAIWFREENSDQFTIFSGGNVGIGTVTNSGFKFDVTGTGRFSSDVTLSTGAIIPKGQSLKFPDGNNSIRFDDSPTWFSGASNVATLASYSGAFVFRNTNLSTNNVTIGSNSVLGTTSLGNRITVPSITVNDAVSSTNATISHSTSNVFNPVTLTSTNTGIVHNVASNVYIGGSPIAGTNTTIANPYSLYINSGNSYFGGNINTQVTSASNWITTPIIIGGGGATSSINYRTTSGAGSIGSDHIFSAGTNGSTEIMRLLNNGNVGIGTVNPTYKLDINGSLRVNGNIESAASGTLNIGTTTNAFGTVVTTNLLSAGGNNLGIKTQSGRDIDFISNITQTGKMFASGNWSLQTGGVFTDDGNKLQVTGNTKINSPLMAGSTITPNNFSLNVNSGWGGSYMQVTDSNTGTTTGDGFLVGVTALQEATLLNREATSMTFKTTNAERMQITAGGNLLIGTTTDANFKVDIAGSTRLQGIATFGNFTQSNGGIGIDGTTANGISKTIQSYGGSPLALNSIGNNILIGSGAIDTGNLLNIAGTIVPTVTNTYQSGTSTYMWARMYANDVFASNIRANTTSGYTFSASNGTNLGKMFDNGNWLIQTGGTFTDNGYKLQIVGNTYMQGGLNVGNNLVTNRLSLDNTNLAGFGTITTGQKLTIPNYTNTDATTSASGTVSHNTNVVFGVTTLNSINTGVTNTIASNVYIAGDPVAGTNTTIGTSYGLYNAGKSYFSGNVNMATGVIVGGTGNTFVQANGFVMQTGTNPLFRPTQSASNYDFANNASTSIIRLNDNGNVGIGTTSPTSKLHNSGSEAGSFISISANQTLAENRFVVVTAAAAITLPTASTCSGRFYTINARSAGVTISSYFDLIGTSQTTITSGTSITLISDGTNWQRVN